MPGTLITIDVDGSAVAEAVTSTDWYKKAQAATGASMLEHVPDFANVMIMPSGALDTALRHLASDRPIPCYVVCDEEGLYAPGVAVNRLATSLWAEYGVRRGFIDRVEELQAALVGKIGILIGDPEFMRDLRQ